MRRPDRLVRSNTEYKPYLLVAYRLVEKSRAWRQHFNSELFDILQDQHFYFCFRLTRFMPQTDKKLKEIRRQKVLCLQMCTVEKLCTIKATHQFISNSLIEI